MDKLFCSVQERVPNGTTCAFVDLGSKFLFHHVFSSLIFSAVKWLVEFYFLALLCENVGKD